MADKLHALVKGLHAHAKDYYREDNDLYTRLMAFGMDSEHYKRERGVFSRETRLLQPKTQLVFDLLRHKGSYLKTQPLRIECMPARMATDLAQAELARRLLEHLTRDNKRRYRPNRNRAIDSALTASRGTMWTSWEPGIGTRFRASDPRLTFVAPGWSDHHDPCCPWVCEEMRVTRRWLESRRELGWDVPHDLVAAAPPLESDAQDPVHRNPDEDGGSVADDEKEPRYTVVRMFFRDDPLRHVRAGEEVPLPRERWRLVGPGGSIAVPPDFDPADPENVRIAEEQGLTLVISEPAPAYRRLAVVFYPEYQGRSSGIAWKGDWFEGAANAVDGHVPFPLFHLASYQHPLRLIGTNDTLLNRTLQLIDNSLMRQMYEQTRQVSSVLVTQWGALLDADRQQFEFTDAPVQMAYATDIQAAELTRFITSPSVNPAGTVLRDMLERAGSRVGTGDIPMPATRSRDVAGVTMQAMQEMGDMPLRVHKQLLDDEEGMFLTATLCLARAYMTDAEVIQWTTDEGEVEQAELRGVDISPVSVIVGSSPDWRAVDSERVQAVAQLAGQASTMPGGLEILPALARMSGFGHSEVRYLQRMVEGVLQKQEAAQQFAMQQKPPK